MVKRKKRSKAAGTKRPNATAVQKAFSRFCATIAALRHPERGCPWDLEQDHKTLRRYMIEEAYEAAEAMVGDDAGALCDELGDVLLQVVLNAQVARDHGNFSIIDVIDAINDKMRRRHPHVFGAKAKPGKVKRKGGKITAADVPASWEAIKAKEKAGAAAKGKAAAKPGVFAGAAKTFPATLHALAIGKIAAKLDFDWDDAPAVFAQVRSEIEEVAEEIRAAAPQKKLAEEIGDVYFSLGQLCRHLKLDPELVASDGNRKFLRRFAQLEAVAERKGIDVSTAGRDCLEDLWKEVKAGERAGGAAPDA